MQWIQYVFSFSTLLTKHSVFVGQQNNPRIPEVHRAGTARHSFEIPGSTTDPLILSPFNQVYLNHEESGRIKLENSRNHPLKIFHV